MRSGLSDGRAGMEQKRGDTKSCVGAQPDRSQELIEELPLAPDPEFPVGRESVAFNGVRGNAELIARRLRRVPSKHEMDDVLFTGREHVGSKLFERAIYVSHGRGVGTIGGVTHESRDMHRARGDHGVGLVVELDFLLRKRAVRPDGPDEHEPAAIHRSEVVDLVQDALSDVEFLIVAGIRKPLRSDLPQRQTAGETIRECAVIRINLKGLAASHGLGKSRLIDRREIRPQLDRRKLSTEQRHHAHLAGAERVHRGKESLCEQLEIICAR